LLEAPSAAQIAIIHGAQNLGPQANSKKVSDDKMSKKAAEHRTKAVEHHREAARLHEAGDHMAAAQKVHPT